jgi:hypothetical protein
MLFTKREGHMGIEEGRRFAINYGVSHSENIQFLKDILFLVKLRETAGAKLSGITGFWIFFLFRNADRTFT